MEKRSFFERLTGSIKVSKPIETKKLEPRILENTKRPSEIPQVDEEGELTIDVWQTPTEIIVQAIVGGVKPEDLDVAISSDTVTIRGKRERSKEVTGADYFYQELYWGSFARSVLLPQEIDSDESEATIKNGLLTIHLPKLDKNKIQKLRVKNE